jgi:alkylated DNA repair dioxygenase AlkB
MISHIIEEKTANDSIFHYLPNFITKEEEEEIYNYLEKTSDFVENPKMNTGISRLQKWYHKEQKYFCPLWKERYPHWMSFEMDNTIIKLIDKIQSFISDFAKINKMQLPNINSCLINKYPTGENFIAPHRDSELSFGLEPTIIGLSIGQTRTIDFHRLDKNLDINLDKTDFSFELESGSIFIMAGSSQRFYHHSLKKTVCENVRYSLTFREFIL